MLSYKEKMKLSKLKVSSATIGPSKSHGSGPEDEEAPTETLTETGVEVMRKTIIIETKSTWISGQHHSFETLNETDQIDTMMTGLKLMNQSILVSKQVRIK